MIGQYGYQCAYHVDSSRDALSLRGPLRYRPKYRPTSATIGKEGFKHIAAFVWQHFYSGVLALKLRVIQVPGVYIAEIARCLS